MNKVTGIKSDRYNFRMYIGNVTEGISADMWENYDGSEQSIVDNARKGTPVKKCMNLNYTFKNSLFPHLSATPDRIILPFGVYADRKTNGSLEIKNTNSYVLKSYENELPTENVVQLVTQMMCCDYDFGELFYFVSNERVENHVIEKHKTKKVQNVIIEHTAKFWDSVLKARKIYNQIFEAKRTYNFKLATELELEMARLEPDPQTSLGYLNYLTERYKDRVANIGMIQGDTDQLMLAREHSKTCAAIKKQEQKKLELEIKLKLAIKDNNVLDFGKNGKLTYYQNKNGSRLLKNAII
jgi:hypothetical protein